MAPNSVFLLFILHLFVVRAASFRGTNEFRNDYQYWEQGSGWFKIHRVPLDWHTAQRQCYYEGAVLASPLDVDIWKTLMKIISDEGPWISAVYSGVHSTFSDGVFSSVEGIPLEKLYVKWRMGQPDNFNKKQYCISYNSDGMQDINCEELLTYICYRPASIADNLTECGTVDREYKLDARTGHCYKFHERAETWPRAMRICQAEGGHLAIIDGEEEALVLKDLFAQHPHLLYTSYQNSAAVGVKEWGYLKSWWTIHGKQLEDAGYAHWSSGQPDDAGGNEGHHQGCGAIFRTGQLDDIWCDKPFAFICEKTKGSLLPDEEFARRVPHTFRLIPNERRFFPGHVRVMAGAFQRAPGNDYFWN